LPEIPFSPLKAHLTVENIASPICQRKHLVACIQLRAGNASHKERCQGYIIAAYNYAMNKKSEDARRHLKTFDVECGNLPVENWVFRERKQIDQLLK